MKQKICSHTHGCAKENLLLTSLTVLNFLAFLLSRTILFINIFLILNFPGYAGTTEDIYFYESKPRITCATDGMPDLKLHLIQTSWFSKP